MTAPLKTAGWLNAANPLPILQQKWVTEGILSAEEVAFLRSTQATDADVRIRETCRTLLAAMEGQIEAQPHVQRLVRLRHLALFRSKIRLTTFLPGAI
jgi:hypothetical protein